MSDRHFRVLQKMYSENVRQTFSSTSEHVFRKCPTDFFEYFGTCIQKMSDRLFRVLRNMYAYYYFGTCIQKMSDRLFRVLRNMYSENVRQTFSSTSEHVCILCFLDWKFDSWGEESLSRFFFLLPCRVLKMFSRLSLILSSWRLKLLSGTNFSESFFIWLATN